MKVVILAGGFGTRISEYTKTIPKPMIRINNKPLIVHIMEHFSKYGIKDFYIALGYKGEIIRRYFNKKKYPGWRINLIETGKNTMTGGRLKRLKKYLNKETFMLTYGDGVSNVNLDPLRTLTNNVKPLVTILEEINNKKLKPKIIFASTSEVYGPVFEMNKNIIKFSEQTDLIFPSKVINRHSYLMSKIYCEKLLELSGQKYIIVRPHNIYGPRMGFSHVIPELINKIKFKKKINVFSPYHSRAFCFIDDAIDQIVKLSLQKKALNKTFNIGNDSEEIKIMELATQLIKLMKSKKKNFETKKF